MVIAAGICNVGVSLEEIITNETVVISDERAPSEAVNVKYLVPLSFKSG